MNVCKTECAWLNLSKPTNLKLIRMEITICDPRDWCLTMNRTLVRVPVERVEKAILLIRGEKVILDADLAALYGISTKRLKEQVRRNRERFPEDFMFELTADEQAVLRDQIGASNLRSQIATSRSHGGRRYLSYAFTEHGALMAANVLKDLLQQ